MRLVVSMARRPRNDRPRTTNNRGGRRSRAERLTRGEVLPRFFIFLPPTPAPTTPGRPAGIRHVAVTGNRPHREAAARDRPMRGAPRPRATAPPAKRPSRPKTGAKQRTRSRMVGGARRPATIPPARRRAQSPPRSGPRARGEPTARARDGRNRFARTPVGLAMRIALPPGAGREHRHAFDRRRDRPRPPRPQAACKSGHG